MPEDHAGFGHADGEAWASARRCRWWSAGHLRQSEVEHLHRAVGLDLDVGGLQVAMRDASLVRGFQRVGDLPRDAQSFIERHRPFRRFALDVLHHQVIWADVVQRANVGMIQRRDRARLLLEAFGEPFVRDFDRYMRSSRVSRALYTSPIPPAPMGSMIS